MTVLGSLDDQAILGYYQPFYLFASVRFGRAETSKAPEEMQDLLSPDKLIGYALARYAFIHEIRHFHDYFGTIAGISLFSAHLQQVRAFANFVEALRSSGKSLELPLDASWFDDESHGETAKGLLRNWRIFLQSTATFTEAFEKTVEHGHHPNDYVIYKKRENNKPDVPTFPLSMGILTGERVTPLTVCYPIGLEVLAEGNAQALQRGLMEVECSASLADRLVTLMESRTIESDDPIESLRANATPYNVTDLLVSKYLRLRGYPEFQRTTILQLTDQALSWSYMRPISKPWEVPATFELVDVGRRFINILEASSVQNLVDGTVPYSTGLLEVYQSVLEEISKSKKPDELRYEGDLVSPIDMIEAIVAHHITAPLLRARLETNHEVFYSIPKYMEKLGTLPQLPVLFEKAKRYPMRTT